MTLNEFEQTVFAVANRSPICETPTIRRLTPTTIGIRVPVTIGGFVDAFFNEQTGTIAFALIQNGARIFGADNTGGWHLHPFENPEEHLLLNDGMPFAEFIAAIEKYYLPKD
jgi:hypothetical protein